MIRAAKPQDAKQICNIYNYYVENTIVSFEEEKVSMEEMEKRILDITTSSYPWLVYEKDNEIQGYSYANKWKERAAYRFSVEATIYLKNDASGKGIGSILYKELLEVVKRQNIHAIIGVISLPNNKSQRLHEKLGFKKVAHFTEVGYKFNKWIDIGFWELVIS